ncbi:hypothetical protein, partial [Klebsiella pneumoniae]|uniref:hypothetical protein n=1 Tax=Klebsiella pneumoniae TaxID=573 RepID=UPI0025A2B8B9
RFMPEGMGKQNVADMSAVRADLSGAEPQTIDELIRAGISPIDFGGGDTMLMKLGEAQGGRAGPLPAGNFGPLEGSTGDILAALPPA